MRSLWSLSRGTQLDLEFKARLVAELRHGGRKQGKGHLQRVRADGTAEWCCVGVACDIIDPNFWEPENTISDRHSGVKQWHGDTHYMPTWAALEVGWTHEDVRRLAILNDGYEDDTDLFPDGVPDGGRPHTFDEIADYIEENY